LDHLQTDEDRAGYLAASEAEGDPVLIAVAKQDIDAARAIHAPNHGTQQSSRPPRARF
jgi:DNA-binding phage protein